MLFPVWKQANTTKSKNVAFVVQTHQIWQRETNNYCVLCVTDPYVKIWLMNDGKKVEKKKTTVKDKTLNPEFNETFAFVVTYDRIRQASLVVSVMDYDRMGRNEPIGQLVLGAKSGPIEMKHWNEMFAKPRQSVVQWHMLKNLSWTMRHWLHSPAPC